MILKHALMKADLKFGLNLGSENDYKPSRPKKRARNSLAAKRLADYQELTFSIRLVSLNVLQFYCDLYS
jgi:hypothetical protein